jgi:hypothetical protein
MMENSDFKLHTHSIFIFIFVFVLNKEGIVGDVEVVETDNKPQSNFPLVQFP